jgi:hypothetical protein
MTDHLAELARTRDATLPYFDADPAVQTRSYAPGKWDMRRFLLHLADSESVYLDRLRRLVADEQPLLWVFDENRWTDRLHPEQRSLRVAADLFRANREAVIELCRLSPPTAWARAGVHNLDGRRTFEEVAAKIWRHNAHHLGQLAAIADGRPWQPTAPSAAQGAPR